LPGALEIAFELGEVGFSEVKHFCPQLLWHLVEGRLGSREPVLCEQRIELPVLLVIARFPASRR
jgi:hypothetical protein